MSSRRKHSSRSNVVPPAPARNASAKITPPATPLRTFSRKALALIFALLVTATIAGIWAWWQFARPGAAHLRSGMQAYDAQLYPLAEQEWLAGIAADPSYVPLHVQLGDLYAQENRYSQAEAQYRIAARFTPDDGLLFLKLNRAALADGDNAAALAAAKRAAQLRPDDPDAQGLYGIQADKADRTADALAALTRAHALRPNDQDYMMALDMLKMRLSQTASARADLTAWLTTHPGDPMASHLLAVSYEQQVGDPAVLRQAIALEQAAQAGMPGDMRVYITLGQLYLAAERPADALRAYQAGLRIDGDSEEMLHGIVRAATMLGDTKAAEAAAQSLQAETMRHQEITHLGDQIGLTQDNESLLLQRAALYLADGNQPDAAADYRRLLARNPGDMEARAALKAFYVHIGRPDLAKEALQPTFMP